MNAGTTRAVTPIQPAHHAGEMTKIDLLCRTTTTTYHTRDTVLLLALVPRVHLDDMMPVIVSHENPDDTVLTEVAPAVEARLQYGIRGVTLRSVIALPPITSLKLNVLTDSRTIHAQWIVASARAALVLDNGALLPSVFAKTILPLLVPTTITPTRLSKIALPALLPCLRMPTLCLRTVKNAWQRCWRKKRPSWRLMNVLGQSRKECPDS